jgi:hypothetical protein
MLTWDDVDDAADASCPDTVVPFSDISFLGRSVIERDLHALCLRSRCGVSPDRKVELLRLAMAPRRVHMKSWYTNVDDETKRNRLALFYCDCANSTLSEYILFIPSVKEHIGIPPKGVLSADLLGRLLSDKAS